jgi:hypothetical protein
MARFFPKANEVKLSLRENAQETSYEVDSFRKPMGYATLFVKYAG